MNIQDYNTLKKYGELQKREKLALEIIEICKRVAKEQHYINAIIAAGEIKALAQACDFDCYWSEKVSKGYCQQTITAHRALGDYKNGV